MTLSVQDGEFRFDDGDAGIDEIIATTHLEKKYLNGFTRCFSIRDAPVAF